MPGEPRRYPAKMNMFTNPHTDSLRQEMEQAGFDFELVDPGEIDLRMTEQWPGFADLEES